MMLPSGASGGDDAEAATVDVVVVTAGDAAGTAVEEDGTDARTRALSETLRGLERPRIAIDEGSRLHLRELLVVLLPRLPLRDDSPLPKPLLVEEPLLLEVLLWRMYRLVHSGSSVSTMAAFSEMILLMCCSRI